MRVAVVFLLAIICAYGQVTCVVGQPSTSFEGFGAEWDPFFWNSVNQGKGLTPEDWDLITTRVASLGQGISRVMMQLHWVQSNPDLTNWTWGTQQMQSILRYLDVLKANNVHIVLTDWGWSVGVLYNSPTDVRYARGMAKYLRELIVNRGYTNIKYLVVGNEPDNEMARTYGMDAYVQLYLNVDQALRAEGIRDLVKLTGPDMGGDWGFMQQGIDKLKNVLDVYDLHRYASYDETSNFNLPGAWETLWNHLDRWRGEVLMRDPNGASKPILLTEMGKDGGVTNSHPDIDTYKYALHMADYGTTLLTTRLNGGIAWNMHDIYYFDWAQFMQWGMWKFKDQNWTIRPWARAFALLSRHSPRGSLLAPINGTPPTDPGIQTYRCAALVRPDGGWSVFLVNREPWQRTIRVLLPTPPRRHFDKYVMDAMTASQFPGQLAVAPGGTLLAAADFEVTLEAESFVTVSEQPATVPPPADPPPTVKITSPLDGAAVSQVISISATASDDKGVTAVTFEMDGSVLGVVSAEPYSITWDTRKATNGIRALKATARDAAGNAASASIVVNVNNASVPTDTTAPTVSITSPAPGATVNGLVNVRVAASDNSGVVKVELYVNGAQADVATVAPFTTRFNASKNKGSFQLQAKAYDAAGNTGLSQVVTVRR